MVYKGANLSNLRTAAHLVSDTTRIVRKSDAVHETTSWFTILYVGAAHIVLHDLRHFAVHNLLS